MSSLSRNETKKNKDLLIKFADRVNESKSSVLELWREKVGNSGNLNPREERGSPTEKSDAAAAPRRGKQRSYHRAALMSSTFRHMWWQWL